MQFTVHNAQSERRSPTEIVAMYCPPSLGVLPKQMQNKQQPRRTKVGYISEPNLMT